MRLVPAALLLASALVPAVLPATAQTIEQAAALSGTQRVALGAPASSGFSLDKMFDPQHFRMSHSVEFSSGSTAGGPGYSLGVYTNTMQWQFDQKLAARLDLAVATSPTGLVPSGFGVARNAGVQAYVRNAEIAYRPTRSTELRIQFQQNPYGQGGYGDAYGLNGYGGYGMNGYGSNAYGRGLGMGTGTSNTLRATFGSGSDGDLFFRGR